jgi:hypothetical protein
LICWDISRSRLAASCGILALGCLCCYLGNDTIDKEMADIELVVSLACANIAKQFGETPSIAYCFSLSFGSDLFLSYEFLQCNYFLFFKKDASLLISTAINKLRQYQILRLPLLTVNEDLANFSESNLAHYISFVLKDSYDYCMTNFYC